MIKEFSSFKDTKYKTIEEGMLYFLLKFPSARRIRRSKRRVVEYEFSKAFEGRGKKPSFSANDIIDKITIITYMEAVVAVDNKLLRTIYAMLTQHTLYSPNYS